MRATHRLLIPERIAGDKEAGERPIAQYQVPCACAKDAQTTCQEKETPDDQQHTCQCDRRGPLSQEHNGADSREQGTGTARERIDQRKIAHAVASLKQEKVGQVEYRAPDYKHDSGERKKLALHNEKNSHQRRVEEDGKDISQPDEWCAAMRALRQKIPGSVRDGRGEGQHEREHIHKHL
jgi:hypothetical protein